LNFLKAVQGSFASITEFKKLGEAMGNGQCLFKVPSYFTLTSQPTSRV